MTSRLPLFALRAPRDTHLRLKAAARADGMTMGEELDRLLDLREIYEAQTRPRHPLGKHAPPTEFVNIQSNHPPRTEKK